MILIQRSLFICIIYKDYNYELENFEEAINKLENNNVIGSAGRFDENFIQKFFKSKKDFDIKQLKFSYTLLLEYLKTICTYKYINVT